MNRLGQERAATRRPALHGQALRTGRQCDMLRQVRPFQGTCAGKLGHCGERRRRRHRVSAAPWLTELDSLHRTIQTHQEPQWITQTTQVALNLATI